MKVKNLLKILEGRDPEGEIYTLNWEGEVTLLHESFHIHEVMVLEESGEPVVGDYEVVPGYPVINLDTGKKITRKEYLDNRTTPSIRKLIKESKNAKFARRLALYD